ncbi:unnamed protein product, partial [Rotaria sp. Silwood1]
MEHTTKIRELQAEDERQKFEMASVNEWGYNHEDEIDQLWDNINR